MELSEKYTILNAKRIVTKYGPTVRLEFESNVMFLPTRYNALSDEEVNELSTEPYYVCRRGDQSLTLYNFNDEVDNVFLVNSQYPTWQ